MALKTVTEYFGIGRDEIDQGEEIITVKVGGDNFLEKVQSVQIIYNFTPDSSWISGSDESVILDIKSIQAGTETFESLGWNIGDVRVINDIPMVLLHEGKYYGFNNTTVNCNFVVGTSNVPYNLQLYKTGTPSGYLDFRNTEIEEFLINSVPSIYSERLISVTHAVNENTYTYYRGKYFWCKTSENYIAKATIPNSEDIAKYTFYKTESNKIKEKNWYLSTLNGGYGNQETPIYMTYISSTNGNITNSNTLNTGSYDVSPIYFF